MSVTLSVEEQSAMGDLFGGVAEALAEGQSKTKLVKQLVRQSWTPEDATAFVDGAQEAIDQYQVSDAGRAALVGAYLGHMVSGFLWAAGGTAVTLATYEAASGGGAYVVAWGAIVFGAFDFLRGFCGWLSHSTASA
jgi:hypothetical protein